MNMIKRHFATLHLAAALFIGVSAGAFPSSPAIAGEQKTGIVELFTSQGCSSCPPADEFSGVLAKRKELLVLTFPVDYWDWMGWKDTLASPENTQRQRDHARSRRDNEVYTPQMVINGRAHAIGSYRSDVEATLVSTRDALESERVLVDIALEGKTLEISIKERQSNTTVEDATIWLALYNRAEKVKIGRGENTGRSVTYYNVVRKMVPIGMWSGEAKDISLPEEDLMLPGFDGCAVIVQARNVGPIYGMASLESWSGN